MDVDRAGLAEQLDDVVIGLHRQTITRQGLSLTAAATLATLRRQGPTRLTELAAAQGVSQPSMTTLVARLTGQGLVDRSGDPADRRAVLISLTDAGGELLDQRRSSRTARLLRPLAQLDEDDVQQITDALPALARLAGVPAPNEEDQ